MVFEFGKIMISNVLDDDSQQYVMDGISWVGGSLVLVTPQFLSIFMSEIKTGQKFNIIGLQCQVVGLITESDTWIIERVGS